MEKNFIEKLSEDQKINKGLQFFGYSVLFT